jgi:heparinase II/III-like protein
MSRLVRLLEMGVAELAIRSRQALDKRIDRAADARRAGFPGSGRDVVPLTAFRQSVGERFFPGPAGAAAPSLPPAAAAETVEAANRLLGKRFDLLGYRDVSFGDPIDWHADPVAGRRAPAVHWTRLDHLDAESVGDHKVIWELNRHQWLVRLAQAYRLTGDERYTRAFLDTVADWIRANPRGVGINWASSLEVSLRLMSWTWALVLFRHSPLLTPAAFRPLVAALRAHAVYVEKYLSYYFSPNTHLTGEALGLFYAGVVFPTLPRAHRWRTLGARILADESVRQVHGDGVYFEQSTCYQRYTVDSYLHFLVLAARAGVTVTPPVRDRVQRMVDVLLALRRPDGSMPVIGDADGGSLLPLGTRAPDDYRALFSTAAAVFHRADYAWAAGGLAPETVWMLGDEGARAFGELRPAPPAGPASRLFAQGGYAVMRASWEDRAHQLIVDAGPLGCPVSGGHGHADLLSVQCAAFGEPYLVDPGMSGYTADPVWREYFRSTAAHSTVSVDGQSQAATAGAFRWQQRPAARVQRWTSTDTADVIDAVSDAYGRLADPVTHRRRVLFVKPRYWLIVDDLLGSAEHRVDVGFQFAPLRVDGDGSWVRAHGRAGSGLLLRAFATAPLAADVIEGWVAPDYGRRRPAPFLRLSTVVRLPLRVVTVLWPVEHSDAPAPDVEALGDGDRLEGVWLDALQEGIRFDDDRFWPVSARREPARAHRILTLQTTGG